MRAVLRKRGRPATSPCYIASASLPALGVACTLQLTAVPDHAAAEWSGCTAPGSRSQLCRPDISTPTTHPASSSLPTFAAPCARSSPQVQAPSLLFFEGKKRLQLRVTRTGHPGDPRGREDKRYGRSGHGQLCPDIATPTKL